MMLLLLLLLLLLSGLGGLSGIVQRFLLLQRVRDLGSVSEKVKVLAHSLLRDRTGASKRVVVECIL